MPHLSHYIQQIPDSRTHSHGIFDGDAANLLDTFLSLELGLLRSVEPDKRPLATSAVHYAQVFELLISSCNGVQMNAEVHRQLPDRREPSAGFQPPFNHVEPHPIHDLPVQGRSPIVIEGHIDDGHVFRTPRFHNET